MRRIAHIINPVKVRETSDLYIAQAITFDSMRRAKAFSGGQVEVELFTVQYSEDREILPDGFQHLPDLQRSVLDFASFETPRKLPLLKDILDSLYEASDADYLVYTNVDIALMPHFYLSLDALLKQYEALVINRRTITDYDESDDIHLLYTQVGKKHEGWDCFVFPRAHYKKYDLGNVIIGAAFVGLLLYSNMIGFAKSFKEITDAHFTFHLGDDKQWLNEKFIPYTRFNASEMIDALNRLRPQIGPYNDTQAVGRYLLPLYLKHRMNNLRPILEADNSPEVLRKATVPMWKQFLKKSLERVRPIFRRLLN